MIAAHIGDLITATKAMPNSLYKNKLASSLHEAYAYASMLEMGLYPGKEFEGLTEPYNAPNAQVISGATCTCPHYPDAISTSCPVHRHG